MSRTLRSFLLLLACAALTVGAAYAQQGRGADYSSLLNAPVMGEYT